MSERFLTDGMAPEAGDGERLTKLLGRPLRWYSSHSSCSVTPGRLSCWRSCAQSGFSWRELRATGSGYVQRLIVQLAGPRQVMPAARAQLAISPTPLLLTLAARAVSRWLSPAW